MKKIILILAVFFCFSCVGKDNSKLNLEEVVTLTGKIDVSLYGCCVSDDSCTTCEDYLVVLDKEMIINGESIDKLVISNPYEDKNHDSFGDIDYDSLYDKNVEIKGHVSGEKKDGITNVEVVEVKLTK